MRDDRGVVTAEFAVAVPAVLLVLAACLGGLRVGVERLRVVDAAAQEARRAAVSEAPGGDGTVRTSVSRRGETVCATAATEVLLLGLPVPVRATSCALAGLDP